MSEGAQIKRILVAEDDEAMGELLQRILSDEGYEVTLARDGKEAIARLDGTHHLVLTDMRMPEADGAEVMAYVQRRWPGTPVVVMTAFGSIPGAVEAMRDGAFDYLTKPLPDPEALRRVVRRALSATSPGQRDERVVARDPAMARVLEQVRLLAPRETTVLLMGESGTGKEVLARMLHRLSPRAEGPFVAVNCAALTESLLESELFGHERGAFTGATSRRQGRFEQAHGGTLLLDEVGETSPGLQAKLLRVLQERTFERVGGTRTVEVDVRLVAATNRDLRAEVSAHRFREDLFYRLAVFPLEIPPLRERPRDILPLAEHFLGFLGRDPNRTSPGLDPRTRDALLAHPWPGNVRELQNVMERAVVLAGGDSICPDHLALELGNPAATPEGSGTLKDMERRAVAAALEATGGNRRQAAKRLGIALRTLQYKIKDYGLK